VPNVAWYAKRLRKMSPAEVAWRARDQAYKAAWAWPALRPRPSELAKERRFCALLPEGALQLMPLTARASVLQAAKEIIAGRFEVLGTLRQDMALPDWALDPSTGKSAPLRDYCFHIDFRDAAVTGNVKQVWEISRLHHVTVLACAYALSGHSIYAERAAEHLRSWWAANTWLSGINWTNGIEVGTRLISFVWVRRLLAGWDGAPELFERSAEALEQLWHHQAYLAVFHSRGSSANNHAIAEAAGLLTGALAFPWYPESDRWARRAAEWLEQDLQENTFPSGVNREMAFDYHGFVAELALVAAAEADRAGMPVSDETWDRIAHMLDVVAASVDVDLRPPRYGDGDDGRALVLDPSANRWEALLALGRFVCGAPSWWPEAAHGALSTLLGSICAKHPVHERPLRRPAHFADAGLTVLRARGPGGGEVWCRLDSGPHGFLSIAAHAHADALSIELRHAGVEILSDPGTYCYHGELAWRSYFRSTLGHNTLEIGERDQSVAAGPFLWSTQATSRLVALRVGEDGEDGEWCAEHEGYLSLSSPALHRRTVRLAPTGPVEILDEVETGAEHPLRLAFHFGPSVSVEWASPQVLRLAWAGAGAVFELPATLSWRLARGETNPPLGWYSPSFGVKEPSWTAIGSGIVTGRAQLVSILHFQGAA
jgi:hypothetical protein